MAGFLKNIAARIGGSEQTLRPRTPSLFEPAAAGFEVATGRSVSALREGHLVGGSIEQVEKTDADVVVEGDVPRSPDRPPDRATGILIATPAQILLDHRLDPEPSFRDPMASTRITDIVRRAQSGPMREPTAVAEAARNPPAPEAARPAIRPSGVAAGNRSAPVVRIRPIRAADLVDAHPLDARRGVTPRTHLPDAASSIATKDKGQEVLSEAGEPAQRMIGILRSPAIARIVSEPLHPAPRAPESQPVIHVTIGRVEVRAVAAPASDNARTERPSPVMSLDEYLRTRAR